MIDKEKLYYWALSCTCCAIIWQITLIIVISTGLSRTPNWLVKPIERAIAERNAVTDTLLKSWNTEPFIDVLVIHTGTYSQNYDTLVNTDCPSTHPDEVFYEVWPGTRQMCDCLERDGDREYYFDIICQKSGKGARHKSPDCINVQARAPIVQS